MMGQCVVGVCRRVALQNMEDAFGGLSPEIGFIFLGACLQPNQSRQYC